ncbi:membrane-associated protein, putative [Bodo saltans]|uniref:Membrane-associated protein, putative n=1 Tax=Bodo saltans TaxID=75058 RepID=A0A0S4IYY3_BODSA|nr:membrane-associated protein, putative [Bodo saltans]|eukprot:CUG60820.1 membrane-associated protein, putative [Bodo saltans]
MGPSHRFGTKVSTLSMLASLTMLFCICVLLTTPSCVSACKADFDCRPSSCCHSTGCVDITKAPPPDCSEVLCSAECQHNTLDCGGECRCNTKLGVCKPYIRAGMPPDSAHTWKSSN